MFDDQNTLAGIILLVVASISAFLIWYNFFRKPNKLVDPYNHEIPEDEVLQPKPTYRELLKESLAEKVDVTILSIDRHKNTFTISFSYPGSEATVVKEFPISGLIINNDISILRGIIKITVMPSEDLLDSTPENGEINWRDVINDYTTYAFFANQDTVTDIFKSS